MKAVVLVVVSACGPGLSQTDTRDVGRNALVSGADDPKAIEKLLRVQVVNGGLWFENPQCAAQFGSAGEIKPDRLREFAGCLATLHLQESTRKDELGDVVVMHYAPGFEVEARVVQESDGPRLTWIGYASRVEGDAVAPTISAAALESLRVAGDPNGPVDPAAAQAIEHDPMSENHAAFTWFNLCLDETGAVTGTRELETTSLSASKAFVDAVKTWRFRPFTIQGQPVAVCSLARLVYPPGKGPAVETVPLPPPPSRGKRPPIVFANSAVRHVLGEGRRIRGDHLISPDDATKTEIGFSRTVQASFRLCLDETGHVESILPLLSSGYASYDRKLIAGMSTWVYQPYTVDGEPVAVCTAMHWIYKQR